MKRICFVSVDVEKDLKSDSCAGVENLDKILDIFKKYGLSATLFVSGEILEKYPQKFRRIAGQFEIASHSFSHTFWSELSPEQRKTELGCFLAPYQRIFSRAPLGFRAPSNIMDTEGVKLLQDHGFLYDSSVLPHYPFFKHYRGFLGKAPKKPYYPSFANCRQESRDRVSTSSILEIPVAGQIFGIPLAGTWLRKLPFLVYRQLFFFCKPNFIALSLHSWDSLSSETLNKLDKMLKLLKKKEYQFVNGQRVLEFFNK